MRNLARNIVRVLITVVLLTGLAQAADQYWFSLAGASNTAFLMKIDETGAVLQGPVQLNVTTPQGTAIVGTAMSEARNGIVNVWMSVLPLSLYRVQFVESNLSIAAFKRLYLPIENPWSIQATQNGSTPFIVMGVNGGPGKSTAKAFGFTPSTGLLNGTSWRVSPRTTKGDAFVSVAADGRMALGDSADGSVIRVPIYAQPLQVNGLPIGVPNVPASASRSAHNPDVTNLLSGGQRLIFYRDVSNGNLVSVAINGTTGERIGGYNVVHVGPGFAANFLQSEAIDPLGRFVVYNIEDFSGDCSSAAKVAFRQISPASGAPIGPEKILVDCGNLGNNLVPLGFDLLLIQ